MLTDNLYAHPEVQRIQYGRETLSSTATEKFSVKPRNATGALGDGYRF